MIRPPILQCVCLSATLLVGCAPSQEGSERDDDPPAAPAATDSAADSASATDEMRATGRVAVGGTGPIRVVNLLTDSGETIGLAGDLLDELMRLAGAVLSVTGPPTQTVQGRAVNVSRYDVVSVDGETPSVGILVAGDDTYRLEGEAAQPLVDVPPELGSQVGAKIWVVGPETAAGLRVRSYGVIRPAG